MQRSTTGAAAPHATSRPGASRIQRAFNTTLDELDADMYEEEEEEDETLDDDAAAYLHDGSRPTFGDFLAPAVQAHKERTEAAGEQRRRTRHERLGMRPYDGSTPVLDAVAGSRGRLSGLPPIQGPADAPLQSEESPAPSTAPAPASADASDAVPAATAAPAAELSVQDHINAEAAELFAAKSGAAAFKADFEPIAQKISAATGKTCVWQDVKKVYIQLLKDNSAKPAELPIRQVTRATLHSVLPTTSGGQRYSPTKKHGQLEYHVSVEFSPTDTRPAKALSCPAQIDKIHVSFEQGKDVKDRYWYHWNAQGRKFRFDSRAGYNHGDMRAVADDAVTKILPRLNCPGL